jgi:hypothetical protein
MQAEHAVADFRIPGSAWILAGASAVAIALAAWIYGGPSTSDDTFIYMRYLGNFEAGRGFVYNRGESSSGLTSPLWALFMAAVCTVFPNSLLTWKLAGLLAFTAAGALLILLLRGWGLTSPLSLLLVLAVAMEPHTFRWASSGMDNGLTALLLTATAACFLGARSRRGELATGALAGLMPFVRPELGLYSIGLLASGFSRRGRARSRILLSAVATVVVTSGAVLAIFGALIPQTAAAKALFLHQPQPWYGLMQSCKISLSGAGPSLAILLALPTCLDERVRDWKRLTLAAAALLVLYFAMTNQLVSTRYGTSSSFALVLAAALAVAWQVRRSGGRPPLSLLAGLTLQCALAIIVLIFFFPAMRAPEDKDIQRVAEFVTRDFSRDGRIALSEIGAFGYFSGLYVIDLGGLTDPATLAWARSHGSPRTMEDLERLLLYRRADLYIDAFASEAPFPGRLLDWEVLGEFGVHRRNLSRGRIVPDTWRIYRLRPRPSAADRSPVALIPEGKS